MVKEDNKNKEKEIPKTETNPEENEKIEIEDILDRDDFDIDDVVSEEKEQSVLGKEEKTEESDEVEVIDVLSDEEPILEEVLDNKEPKKTEKSKKKKIKEKKQKAVKSEKKWLKIVAIILLTALVTAAAVLGIMYYMGQRGEKDEEIEAPFVEEMEGVLEESEEQFVYISSEVGLNMREEPDSNSKSLAVIPFGTKIPVLEKSNDWIKTEYEQKEGWVFAEFVTETDPLVYENKVYGFGFTFKPSWAGYNFFEIKGPESTAVIGYYVAVPTNDKNWKEGNSVVPAGYASLFAMGVYTKAEWAKMEGGDIKPAKLGESEKYVYTYLPGQAHPTDLGTQYNEINDIIKTFEVLKS